MAWDGNVDEDQGRLVSETNRCREMKQMKNEKMLGKEIGKRLAESHGYHCFFEGYSICTSERHQSTLYCRRAKKIKLISALLSFFYFPFSFVYFTSGCGIYVDRLFPSTLSTCY